MVNLVTEQIFFTEARGNHSRRETTVESYENWLT